MSGSGRPLFHLWNVPWSPESVVAGGGWDSHLHSSSCLSWPHPQGRLLFKRSPEDLRLDRSTQHAEIWDGNCASASCRIQKHVRCCPKVNLAYLHRFRGASPRSPKGLDSHHPCPFPSYFFLLTMELRASGCWGFPPAPSELWDLQSACSRLFVEGDESRVTVGEDIRGGCF